MKPKKNVLAATILIASGATTAANSHTSASCLETAVEDGRKLPHAFSKLIKNEKVLKYENITASVVHPKKESLDPINKSLSQCLEVVFRGPPKIISEGAAHWSEKDGDVWHYCHSVGSFGIQRMGGFQTIYKDQFAVTVRCVYGANEPLF
jgi:hypothetical protein